MGDAADMIIDQLEMWEMEYGGDMEEYELAYVHHTEAGLCVTDGDREIWLPQSQIEWGGLDLDTMNKGEMMCIEIPDWLAEKKELI